MKPLTAEHKELYQELYEQEWLIPVDNKWNYKQTTCEVDLHKLTDFILLKIKNEQMQFN